MNNSIPFAALRLLLQGLGFQETHVPNSHVAFEHPATGTVLPFRDYAPGAKVSPGDLAVTRRFLVERGLLAGEEFDRLLHGGDTAA